VIDVLNKLVMETSDIIIFVYPEAAQIIGHRRERESLFSIATTLE